MWQDVTSHGIAGSWLCQLELVLSTLQLDDDALCLSRSCRESLSCRRRCTDQGHRCGRRRWQRHQPHGLLRPAGVASWLCNESTCVVSSSCMLLVHSLAAVQLETQAGL